MCNVRNEESHDMERGIFVYTKNENAFSKTFEEFIAFCKASDLLQCGEEVRGTFGGKNQYSFIRLNNTTVSRKKWEIVFREFYSFK